jgi:hypothetical protein
MLVTPDASRSSFFRQPLFPLITVHPDKRWDAFEDLVGIKDQYHSPARRAG